MKVEYKKFAVSRTFGVELEVNATISQYAICDAIQKHSEKPVSVTTGWAYSCNNNYWHVKFDSSCGVVGKGTDYGWEVASYIASGAKDITHVSHVAGHIQKAGAQVNQNCGLHVHVGIPDFDVKDAGKLLARWIKLERFVVQMLPKHRRKNKYCRLLTSFKTKLSTILDPTDPEHIWSRLKPTNMGQHENRQKKVALNMVNYARCLNNYSNDGRKTVELRLPEGTLNEYEVKNWVRFFLLFVENSKLGDMPENLKPIFDMDEFFSYLGLSSKSSFYLLSEGMQETKLWVLGRWLEFGSPIIAQEARKRCEMMT
jgi:hypothetical protein